MATLSDETGNHRRLLFRSLRVVNFVIHRDTVIRLDRSPITLITGANGSGKTLLLDALLLALGGASSRVKQQRLTTFIGPFGKRAEIELKLNNHRINGHRVLRSQDQELDKLLNRDLVEIRLRINPGGTTSIWVNGVRKLGRRPITRQEVRRIFRSAGVLGDVPLSFTEQQTLDQFASQSPHRKFEILLESTGLRGWMERLEEARILVAQAQAEAEPLIQRIRREEQKLQALKAASEAFEEKRRLQERLKKLEMEEAWAEVAQREQVADKLGDAIAQLEERLREEEANLERLARRWEEVEEERRGILSRRAELREAMASLRDQQMELKGQRSALERQLRETNEQIARYSQAGGEASSSHASPTTSSRVKVEVLQEELEELVAERDRLDERLAELRRRIAALEEEPTVEPRRLTLWEEDMLKGCTEFRKILDEEGLSDQVIGPIFALISMKPGEERYEEAVKRSLGRYAYAFLALGRRAFSRAKTLFDRRWPHLKPNLLVARVDPDDTARHIRPPVSSPVHGWAADLLQGEPHATAFLSRVINTAVAEPTANPNELADAAQQLGSNIITSDCSSYYLRIGAFTRPPPPVTIPLGRPPGQAWLGQGASGLRHQLEELRREEARLTLDRMRLHSNIGQLRLRLHALQQPQAVAEAIPAVDCRVVVIDLQHRAETLQQQLADLEGQLAELSEEYHRKEEEVSKLQPRLRELEDTLRRLEARRLRREAEIERLSRELHRRKTEMTVLQDQLRRQREQASRVGPRPKEIRTPGAVREERVKVQAMIESIRATEEDKRAFEEQQRLVRRLHGYLEERKRHLENLMSDVQRRLGEWRRRLEETVEALNRRMNQLLCHFLKQVKLIIRYPDDPSRAELYIQTAIDRKGSWRTYRNISGGERVLATQIFILALHTLARSPLHVIDEFTQRLDEASRAAVLNVVQRAAELSREDLAVEPQFLLMAPTSVGLQIPPTIHHVVLVKGQVKK